MNRTTSALPLVLGLLLLASCSPAGLATQGTVTVWEAKPDRSLSEVSRELPGLRLERSESPQADLLHLAGTSEDRVVDTSALLDLEPYRARLSSLANLWPALVPAPGAQWTRLPSSVSVWGLFYNPTQLEAWGLEPPVDWVGFERVLAALKEKGKTPLALGASFGWPALAWLSIADLRLNGPEAYDRLLSGQRSFEEPTFVAALETLVQWRNKGWFDPQATAQNWPECLAAVKAGEAGFVLLGSFGGQRVTDGATLAFLPVPPHPKTVSQQGELAIVQGFAVARASLVPEAALSLADAYVGRGSPGQAGEPFVSPVLRTSKGTGVLGVQNAILAAAKALKPPLETLWDGEAEHAATLLVQQFFASGSSVSAADLAASLQRLPRGGRNQ